MKSFHNTTGLTGEELKTSELKANKEEVLITSFFLKYPADEYSPCQVWQLMDSNKPLTNFRRAITNLTNAGVLVKTGKRIRGFYGATVNTWKLDLTKDPRQGVLF